MTSASAGIPGGSELSGLAAATAERCGVDLGRIAGGTELTSPINGERLFSVGWADATAVDVAVDRARDAFRQ